MGSPPIWAAVTRDMALHLFKRSMMTTLRLKIKKIKLIAPPAPRPLLFLSLSKLPMIHVLGDGYQIII